MTTSAYPAARGSRVGICILLFSGGRDSTLAAVRLADIGYSLRLLVLTGPTLVGFEAVQRRLGELASVLPTDTTYYVASPSPVRSEKLGGCFPCQLRGVAAAVALARTVGACAVATGYSGYQSGWLEQSPTATDELRRILASHQIRLELPVYNVSSKEGVMRELERRSLQASSFEQKCIVQQQNPKLSHNETFAAISHWTQALNHEISSTADIFALRGPWPLRSQ